MRAKMTRNAAVQRAGNRLPAEARRESITSAAVRLFSEYGFRAVTTRRLAAAVGISEPVLYEHFANKQELYDAVHDRMFEALRDLNELMGREHSSDVQECLVHIAEAIDAWFNTESAHVRLVLFGALEYSEQSVVAYRRVRARLIEALTGILAARLMRYGSAGISAETMAHTFICMTVHDALIRVLFGNGSAQTGDQVRTQMVEIFLHGAVPRRVKL
jgi:TetR/AcrR family transcriptional regulator